MNGDMVNLITRKDEEIEKEGYGLFIVHFTYPSKDESQLLKR